jgi:hypothetical protein
MPIVVVCPGCTFTGTVPDRYHGREVVCRSCGTRFPVDGPVHPPSSIDFEIDADRRPKKVQVHIPAPPFYHDEDDFMWFEDSSDTGISGIHGPCSPREVVQRLRALADRIEKLTLAKRPMPRVDDDLL